MKKYIAKACLAGYLICNVCLSANADDLISVTEESLPQLPTPPQESSEILIQHLKGLVLLGENDPLLSDGELRRYRGIYIKGAKVPGDAEILKAELNQYLGEQVTVQTIYDIKSTINSFYEKDNKRPFVIVQVPGQEVTSSVLQLRVYETRLGEVRVEGNRWGIQEAKGIYRSAPK